MPDPLHGTASGTPGTVNGLTTNTMEVNMCYCAYCKGTGPVKEGCCYSCEQIINSQVRQTPAEQPSRLLHCVTIDIEYFDDDATEVQSLLWQLMRACESFSHEAESRMVF